MAKRPVTPTYVIFYILFLPDSWRILMGIGLGALLGPHLIKPGMDTAGRAMMFVMLAVIGYAVSGVPAKWITTGLKKWILGPGGR
ncbi:MAG: hypothetical protein R6U41_04815 [Desulfosalsimonas sp.]|uniref:hypothetical protein n=1 Tax=Desulfosalsimonas sp. TaxID=3073848 RepID=UPI003970A7E7